MNIECDRCEHCDSFKKYKELKEGWEGYCKKYKVNRMYSSESCSKFNFSKDAIENYELKVESVEHNGVR